MKIENTFVLLKPDAVYRHLIGRIIRKFEDKGLKISALKMVHMDRPSAERLYAVHRDRHFFDPLMTFVTSGPCVGIIVTGPSAIEVVRRLVGDTHGKDALPGTVRGDFGLHQRMNLIHASDSAESFRHESGVIFGDQCPLEYTFPDEDYIHGN